MPTGLQPPRTNQQHTLIRSAMGAESMELHMLNGKKETLSNNHNRSRLTDYLKIKDLYLLILESLNNGSVKTKFSNMLLLIKKTCYIVNVVSAKTR